MTTDKKGTRAEFDNIVNMTAKELRRWLHTDESKSVGQKSDGGGEWPLLSRGERSEAAAISRTTRHPV
ncbi:DUF3140 domain-containing protein [Nocardia exalbida]|uniref:DUF3140 domain-containing protein n=1 Tax=Nocardia exalbida TaxID=290231 RepID=UPI0002DE2EAE|nr:DUF3140 domain-containing protein [Nocardia exalbida]